MDDDDECADSPDGSSEPHVACPSTPPSNKAIRRSRSLHTAMVSARSQSAHCGRPWKPFDLLQDRLGDETPSKLPGTASPFQRISTDQRRAFGLGISNLASHLPHEGSDASVSEVATPDDFIQKARKRRIFLDQDNQNAEDDVVASAAKRKKLF